MRKPLRESSKIAIEIKTFGGLSKVNDFHAGIGQYVDYRIALQEKDPDRVLYLAILDNIYQELFSRPFAQLVMKELKIKLIVVEPFKVEITQWID